MAEKDQSSPAPHQVAFFESRQLGDDTSGRTLLGFDPVTVYSFLIFNAFVFYLLYIAIADRKDRIHRRNQAQLLRDRLATKLDKDLLAVLPDDQLHKAVVHLKKTEFKMKYGHHHHHGHGQNQTMMRQNQTEAGDQGQQQQRPMVMAFRPAVDQGQQEAPVLDFPAPFAQLQQTPKQPNLQFPPGAVATSPGQQGEQTTTRRTLLTMRPWGYTGQNSGQATDYMPELATKTAAWKELGLERLEGVSSNSAIADFLSRGAEQGTIRRHSSVKLSGLPPNMRLIVLTNKDRTTGRVI